MLRKLFAKLFGSKTNNQLYVGNIPYKISKGELERIFGKYGQISEIRIVRDRNTGDSKGFCFITYESASSAKAALELNQSEIRGRSIIVAFAKSKED
jgi:RNA recognition motif-containing protein